MEGHHDVTAWVPKDFPARSQNTMRKKTNLVCTKEYYKTILTKSGECRVGAECGLSFEFTPFRRSPMFICDASHPSWRRNRGLSILTFPLGLAGLKVPVSNHRLTSRMRSYRISLLLKHQLTVHSEHSYFTNFCRLLHYTAMLLNLYNHNLVTNLYQSI